MVGGIFFSEIEGWNFLARWNFFFRRLRGGIFYSVAQWFGTYGDHDHKVNDSTPSLVLLFRPWIRGFNFFEKNFISSCFDFLFSKIYSRALKVNGSTPSPVSLFRPWIRGFQVFLKKIHFKLF